MKQYYRRNKLDQKYTATRWMKCITLMLLNLHTNDWRNYHSLIHFPVPNVKHSTPALSTLLTLVTKYYSLSTTLPSTKKKWFSRRITQFNTWIVIELQKWIRTAKRIIHTDNLKRKKSLNNIASTTIARKYIYKIIPATNIQIIAKRKSTSITSFLNHTKDNWQHHAFQDHDEYRKTQQKGNNIQVKVKQRTSKPNYILSTQQTHTIIHRPSFSPKIQQRIQFKT